MPELQVVIEGLCAPRRFLDLVRDFIVFEDDDGGASSRRWPATTSSTPCRWRWGDAARAELARASRRCREGGATRRAASPAASPGDRRVGVVWHTQGSGKSLTMAFYAGRIIREPAMENPTLVVLTDRNDLDDQLFGTFSRCQDLLRQPPVQAESRAHLRELLSVAAGGVVFTTIHKFFPRRRATGTRRSPSAATSW
jgi:type I restriction enzyme, R subunit